MWASGAFLPFFLGSTLRETQMSMPCPLEISLCQCPRKPPPYGAREESLALACPELTVWLGKEATPRKGTWEHVYRNPATEQSKQGTMGRSVERLVQALSSPDVAVGLDSTAGSRAHSHKHAILLPPLAC